MRVLTIVCVTLLILGWLAIGTMSFTDQIQEQVHCNQMVAQGAWPAAVCN